MPWTNLAEEIQEELSAVGFDRQSLYRDGLRWTKPIQDSEERKNYDRWYMKFVWRPTHKEYDNARKNQYYHEVVKKDPEKYKALLERKRRYIQKERNPDGYARKLELNKLRRLAKKDTPEWKSRNDEYNRRRREKYQAKGRPKVWASEEEKSKAYKERRRLQLLQQKEQDPSGYARTLEQKRLQWKAKSNEYNRRRREKAALAKEKDGKKTTSST
jgi:hypothetical protein